MENLKNLSLSNIMSCLALVEKYLERRSLFENYKPNNDFVPKDIVSIQKEASSMMKFVGLQGYTTVITYERAKKGTAGSINLNQDKEVFIEIDKDLLDRPKAKDTILGVLAHEICHKLLYTHGLYMSDTETNEICTDLATIYVGFGLLTIHGCSTIKTWKTEKHNNDGSRTITTHTQTFSTGYLTPKTYILAYIMMARSYGLKDKELGIIPDNNVLRVAYKSAKLEAKKFKLYTKDHIKEQFIRKSSDIASIKKNIILLRTMLDDLERNMIADYKHLDNLNNKVITQDIEKYPIASMYFMNFDKTTKNRTSLKKKFDSFVDVLMLNAQSSIEILNEKTKYVSCPICGQKSSKPLNENNISIRKCKCGRIFVWNAELFEEPQNSFWEKLKRLLGIY